MDLSRMPKNLFDDSELLSQFENQYYSQNEELKLYKKKCEELQQAVDKSCDEKGELQRQLISAKTAIQQVRSNAEAEKEAQRIEHTAKLSSAKIETEYWKQMAETVKKEVQLLKDQIKVVQRTKTEACKRLTDLQAECVVVRKHKQIVDIRIRNQNQAMQDLRRQFDVLESTQKQLVTQLDEQEKQVNLFKMAFTTFNAQRKLDADKITDLEQKIVELNSSREQEKQKASQFAVREQQTDALILRLRTENEELNKGLVALSELSSNSNGCNTLLTKCEEVYEQLKCATGHERIVESPHLT